MEVDIDADLLRAQLESEGLAPEEVDQLMARKVSEEMDRAYAEHIERTLLKESLDAEHDELRRRTAVPSAMQFHESDIAEDMEEHLIEPPPAPVQPAAVLEDEEDPELHEAILKSLEEK
jgi:hypothetical protein